MYNLVTNYLSLTININIMKNMGRFDRIIRIIIAIVIAILYFTEVITGTIAYILIAVGAIFLLTSLISTCPLYLPFGINTRKKHS